MLKIGHWPNKYEISRSSQVFYDLKEKLNKRARGQVDGPFLLEKITKILQINGRL